MDTHKKTTQSAGAEVGTSADAVIQFLTQRGILGDKKIDDEKVRAIKQQKAKNAYHNTLLLLKHYRTIAWLLECFPDTIAQELDQPFEQLDKLIDRLDMEMAMGNRKLENRLAGIEKSRVILDRVNEALTVLKKKPEDGQKLYDLIYLTFIAPETLNHSPESLKSKDELMHWLVEHGANHLQLMDFCSDYMAKYCNELCWQYPISDGKHLGTYIVLVKEGVLSLPYPKHNHSDSKSEKGIQNE